MHNKKRHTGKRDKAYMLYSGYFTSENVLKNV